MHNMGEQETFDALTDLQKEKMLHAPQGDSGRVAIEAVMRLREHNFAERVAHATELSARWSPLILMCAAIAAVGAVGAAVVELLTYLAKH
jgi:hypothetical protein